MSFYNPATGEIVWRVSPTAYECFHEYAHLEQQALDGPLWRAFRIHHRAPVAGKLLNFCLEIDAARRARRDLRACGILEPQDIAQALEGLFSYWLDLFACNRVFPPVAVPVTPALPRE